MKERVRAIGALTALMSQPELRAYNEAQRLHRHAMAFDVECRLSPEQRASVLLFLEICAAKPAASKMVPNAGLESRPTPVPRKLTVFELSRLRREVQSVVGTADAPERLREVVWAIEDGALRRFQTLHGIRIALKKLREGAWTRPHRMPPNWARALSTARGGEPSSAAGIEPCRTA
jgi:hypothetical protein